MRLEILDFCRSDQMEKALSPELPSGARKKAHAISEEFGLDHASEGDGMQRHLVLRKGSNFCQDRFPASRDEEPKVCDPKMADQFLAEVKNAWQIRRARRIPTTSTTPLG